MATTTRRPAAKRETPPTKRRKPPITRWFENWRGLRDQNEVVEDRIDDLHDRLLEAIQEWGETDADGHSWYDLPQPVEFTDHEGKKFIYRTLKSERHLIPKDPVPDPAKAVPLLESKGLWLTEAQLKALQNLRTNCPYAIFTVDVDPDAVAKAYLAGLVTEAEYNACLKEQKVNFHFIQGE
jgi:hypothetical protein